MVLKEELEKEFRQIVEDAGAIWVGVQYGSKQGPVIMFQGAKGASTIGLYAFALKNVDDVKMAVKSKREQMEMVATASAI